METLTPDKSKKFINPYNFISKTTKVERSDEQKGDLTGCIECTLTIKTPLLLPDRSAPFEGAKNRFDFFKANNRPIIPGSEIRGCIRSVYEAITPSCFSVINTETLHRRVSRKDVPTMLGEHNKCDGENGYCPACNLFGIIGNGNSLSSKVRFTDGIATDDVVIGKERIIPELASPKITALEFYTKIEEGKAPEKRWTYDDEGVELRGRKFYFHSKPKTCEELNKRNISTCPAEEGSFNFKVYFDKITKDQLKQLLWVITIGENKSESDYDYLHKIGYGKPVGYGSVKMTVKGIVLRSYSDAEGYCVKTKTFDDYSVSEDLFSEKDALNELKLISNYKYVINKTVSYPIADDGKNKKNSKASHQWFTSNRPQGKSFRFTLPELASDSSKLELPAMTANDK